MAFLLLPLVIGIVTAATFKGIDAIKTGGRNQEWQKAEDLMRTEAGTQGSSKDDVNWRQVTDPMHNWSNALSQDWNVQSLDSGKFLRMTTDVAGVSCDVKTSAWRAGGRPAGNSRKF